MNVNMKITFHKLMIFVKANPKDFSYSLDRQCNIYFNIWNIKRKKLLHSIN